VYLRASPPASFVCFQLISAADDKFKKDLKEAAAVGEFDIAECSIVARGLYTRCVLLLR
jgi:hypothetical protein